MNEFNSECFPIGLCEYPVQIEYEWDEDKIRIYLCRIDVSGDSDRDVWAKIEPDYYPSIERQLKKELEEAQSGIVTPDSEVANWPRFLHRQAS